MKYPQHKVTLLYSYMALLSPRTSP